MVASTTSETCPNQNLRRYTRMIKQRARNLMLTQPLVDQQFYNLTTKNTSEIQPEYSAIKNKIRKPLSHLFIINIYSKHEAETGECNILAYSHYVSSLACVSRLCQHFQESRETEPYSFSRIL